MEQGEGGERGGEDNNAAHNRAHGYSEGGGEIYDVTVCTAYSCDTGKSLPTMKKSDFGNGCWPVKMLCARFHEEFKRPQFGLCHTQKYSKIHELLIKKKCHCKLGLQDYNNS